MKYIYYCERCGITFEVDVDEPIPQEATCSQCGHEHARKVFPASLLAGGSSGGCAPSCG